MNIKRKILTGLCCMAATFLASVSFAPVVSVCAEPTKAEKESVVINMSEQVSDGALINDYNVSIAVKADATVDVIERFMVQFSQTENEFSRSIPCVIGEVKEVSLVCEENEALSCSVQALDNATMVAVSVDTALSNVYTYKLGYTINVAQVNAGEFVFALSDEEFGSVQAEISLPESVAAYDTQSEIALSTNLSLDGKTLIVSADEVEAVAENNAIAVRVTLPDKDLVEEAKTVLESTLVSVWLPMIPYLVFTLIVIASAVLMIVA